MWSKFNGLVASCLTKIAASMNTFWALLLLYLTWIVFQSMLGTKAFDPYPFALLLFISNSFQILWMPVITVSTDQQQKELHRILINQAHMTEAIIAVMERLEAIAQRTEDLVEKDLAVSAQVLEEARDDAD